MSVLCPEAGPVPPAARSSAPIITTAIDTTRRPGPRLGIRLGIATSLEMPFGLAHFGSDVKRRVRLRVAALDPDRKIGLYHNGHARLPSRSCWGRHHRQERGREGVPCASDRVGSRSS